MVLRFSSIASLLEDIYDSSCLRLAPSFTAGVCSGRGRGEMFGSLAAVAVRFVVLLFFLLGSSSEQDRVVSASRSAAAFCKRQPLPGKWKQASSGPGDEGLWDETITSYVTARIPGLRVVASCGWQGARCSPPPLHAQNTRRHLRCEAAYSSAATELRPLYCDANKASLCAASGVWRSGINVGVGCGGVGVSCSQPWRSTTTPGSL